MHESMQTYLMNKRERGKKSSFQNNDVFMTTFLLQGVKLNSSLLENGLKDQYLKNIEEKGK